MILIEIPHIAEVRALGQGQAIRLNSQDADAYYNRALVYTLLGKDNEAQQDFRPGDSAGD